LLRVAGCSTVVPGKLLTNAVTRSSEYADGEKSKHPDQYLAEHGAHACVEILGGGCAARCGGTPV